MKTITSKSHKRQSHKQCRQSESLGKTDILLCEAYKSQASRLSDFLSKQQKERNK